jgi:flagellar protein FliS
MNYASANQAYTESSILTAPPERLVVMLYDGAIRFLTQAAFAARAGDRQQFGNRLRRGQAIIDELNLTLDMNQGEISQQLRGIYLFCKRHLMEAHVHCDPKRVDRVIALLVELRESWQQVAATATTRASSDA